MFLTASRYAPGDLGTRKFWKYKFHWEKAVKRQVLFPAKVL